eukprot:TRINITY_DN5639_c0_g1_i3.p1 TRINITY_DN5639_c0_g1~~TRINITY_DN5639_c0_g1_i3.p1  ORF type:complete len:422 (-),score=56.43 TRINITY_DN5639_c0_g1_i3:91-1356(-)
MESGLEYIGFLGFENPLKKDTIQVIKELLNAEFSAKVISGDHPISTFHTANQMGLYPFGSRLVLADVKDKKLVVTNLGNLQKEGTQESIFVNVEQETERLPSGLANADQIIMTGAAFEMLSELGSWVSLIERTIIFSRMKPEQKARVIQQLQTKGTATMMVGDGANDCTALKQADIGLAFSETEASYSAPFISLDFGLRSVIQLLLEARATILNNVEIFRYMLELSMMKYVFSFVLAWTGGNLTDAQYLYINSLVTIPALISLGLSAPIPLLTRYRPPSNVFSKYRILGFYSHLLRSLPEYEDPELPNPLKLYSTRSVDNAVIFLTSNLAFTASSISVVISVPFKERFWRNRILLVWTILSTLYNASIFLIPQFELDTIHDIIPQFYKIPFGSRAILLLINAGFYVILIVFEELIIKRFWL